MFAERQDAFFINIADPPRIVVIEARNPTEIPKTFKIPAAGPHGLDLDVAAQRLFCACDAKRLICLDARSGKVSHDVALSGTPDVIFFNAQLSRLYVAIGDPGVIDVVDTERMGLIETIKTEAGAHTIGFDAQRNKVYAFLPGRIGRLSTEIEASYVHRTRASVDSLPASLAREDNDDDD